MPDSEELTTLPSGFVEVPNPAFPNRMPPPPVAHRGRRFGPQSVAPYFAEGAIKEAKAAFDRGEFSRARSLLAKQGDALPVRYLRALSALKMGDFAFASVEMSALVDAYPAMRDRCLTHAAIAYEGLGKLEQASRHFAEVAEGSRLFPEARLGLSRVLRRRKDLSGAVAALAPLTSRSAGGLGREFGMDAYWVMADIAVEKRSVVEEQEALWKLWSLHPLSSQADEARKRLRGAKPSVPTQVARAEQLIELHRNKVGLELLEPLLAKLKLPDPLACRARFAYGKALRKERQHTRAIAELKPLVEACQDPDLRARALYVLGSSCSIVEVDKGSETYEVLSRDYPTHSFADDALFYAADLHLKSRRPADAMARLDELAKLYPQGDFLGEALFKAFWIARAQKAPDGGLAWLDRIEAQLGTAEETYDLERARYWRARVLWDGGKKPEALSLFERLAYEHPATYYGLMARSQLAALDAPRLEKLAPSLAFTKESTGPWPLFAGPMGEDPHFLAGVELLRLGFMDAVPSELLAVNRTGQPAESIRLLVQLLSLAGDTRGAHAVARVALRRDLSGRLTPATRPVWEVAYPNAFRELIEKHTSAAGFEADLLQALMREESALDPKALSWAGALGLTQLMPATARAVARELKLPARQAAPAKLLEPDLNIRLGAWYLGSLLKRFDGNKPYAIGSYNAGPSAINRWRGDHPGLPLDAWVEEIPIAETRGYVKRVLRSYNTYQLLYGSAPPAPVPVSARP